MTLCVSAGMLVRVDRYVPAAGYVTAEVYAEVRPAVQGVVGDILARSGQSVAEGEVLVQLEDAEERAARDELGSRARKAEADLARRKAQIDEESAMRESRIEVAGLRLEHASNKLQLAREMGERGLASASAVRDAVLGEQLAQAELAALRTSDRSVPEKELAVLQQEIEATREAVARAEARLRARRIAAPVGGRVVRYSFVVGELVRPDTVLYEIFGGERQVLKLRVPERYAALVEPGQPYRARLTSSRRLRRTWSRGEVETLRDVIQSDNRQTYRLVVCSFPPPARPVPPGTTAEAQILVGRAPLWWSLFGIY